MLDRPPRPGTVSAWHVCGTAGAPCELWKTARPCLLSLAACADLAASGRSSFTLNDRVWVRRCSPRCRAACRMLSASACRRDVFSEDRCPRDRRAGRCAREHRAQPRGRAGARSVPRTTWVGVEFGLPILRDLQCAFHAERPANRCGEQAARLVCSTSHHGDSARVRSARLSPSNPLARAGRPGFGGFRSWSLLVPPENTHG